MSTSKSFFQARGSISKDVKLNYIDYKILENTCVAELVEPYADYYGSIPECSKPNALFLFTRSFYSMEELTNLEEDCKDFFGYTKKLDIATAILDFTDHYHFAIRIGNFPDYVHIQWLQSCFTYEGIRFARRIGKADKARATVFKSFELEKLDEGIYLDNHNPLKGYVTIPQQMNGISLRELLIRIRNNNDCELFDAALGTLDLPSGKENMLRIYSGNLNFRMLNCVKNYILRLQPDTMALQSDSNA